MSRLQVSVVIPTHNRASLVPIAVNSALACTEPGDEVIVVDDGSTDATAGCLAAYGDRIRYVQLPHRGAGATRNHGIELARNPLVAFLDSDDTWMPDKLQLQRALMEQRPEVLFCFSDFASRSDAGERTRGLPHWHEDPRPWDEILGPGLSYSSIAPLPSGRADFRVHMGDLYLPEMERDYVPTFTLVARRDAGSSLHFAEDVVTYEDWECFARLARAGTAAFLDCETAWQHRHPGPRLTDANVFDRVTSRLCILERVWGTDEAFLAAHGERYRRLRRRYQLERAAALLRHGMARRAREDLRGIDDCPLRYRLFATLPGPMAGGLVRLGRSLQRTFAPHPR